MPQTVSADLAKRIDALKKQIAEIEDPVRARIRKDRAAGVKERPAPPKPYAAWDFSRDLRDTLGELHGKAMGTAKIADGSLKLDGKSYVVTGPLQVGFKERTLEAWVKLDNITQRGGGVIGIQSHDGGIFDTVVFGENKAGHWYPGSEFYRRSQPLNGTDETDAKFVALPNSPRYTQQLLARNDGLLIAHGDGLVRFSSNRTDLIVSSRNPFVSLSSSRRDSSLVFAGRSAGFTIFQAIGTNLVERRNFPELGQIRAIHEDAAGALWLSTSTRGAHRLQVGLGPEPWTNVAVTTYDAANGKLDAKNGSVVCQESPLGLSFYTALGQRRFDPATDRFVVDDRFRWRGAPLGVVGLMTPADPERAWASVSPELETGQVLCGLLQKTSPATAEFSPLPLTVQDLVGSIGAAQMSHDV